MDERVAITISINYSDFLSESLQINRPRFHHYYIITEESDIVTINVAKRYDCNILFASNKTQNGAVFNKSGMIHAAQKQIHKTHPLAWIVIMDADICLPSNIWKSMGINTLNKNTLYGLSRKIFETKEDFDKQNPNAVVQEFKKPIGYFQMYWNKTRFYPVWSKNCSLCDIDFKNMFTKTKVFNEISCMHIGKCDSNWDGRVTELWTSEPNT
jgi:hypothetical protein